MARKLSRREFLKLSSITIGAAALTTLSPTSILLAEPLAPKQLGRITIRSLRIMTRPSWRSDLVDYKHRDEAVEVYRAVVGDGSPLKHNHVWYEIAEGFLHSSWVQPVKDEAQAPLKALPAEGFFGDISVPFTDARADADPNSPIVYRLYYSVVVKVDEIKSAPDGSIWYHVADENGKSYWVLAQHLRRVPPEEITPLSPHVSNKRLVVDLKTHWLSAYEGKAEVFRTRVASGATFFQPDGSAKVLVTPGGVHPIWNKRISRHMEGGSNDTDGYDLPGVGWVSYFGSHGEAIHSTYWHNDYGRPRSHGCLNCSPAAAKWLFRWTTPEVKYTPGDITVQWPGGTRLEVQGTPPPLAADAAG
jgi:hypothetical protein